MNVLHLISNYRWTEVAEPAAEMAIAEAALGADVTFICGAAYKCRNPLDSIENNMILKGLRPEILEMTKHIKLIPALRDITRIQQLIRDRSVDVVHCHKENAHLLGYIAAMRCGRNPVVVASCYEPEGPKHGLRTWCSYKFGTNGVVVIGKNASRDVLKRFGFDQRRVSVIVPPVDLSRFDPGRNVDGRRHSFQLKDSDFVIGMVTRIRRSRRLDVAIEAVGMLASVMPQLRLLIIGRGSDVQDVVWKRVKRLGIQDRVILGEYCRGDRLVSAYRAMDMLFYAVPGTDKSCRTIREAMSAGVPVIASRTGFLPELIDDNVNGRLINLSSRNLADVVLELNADRTKLKKIGEAALAKARNEFSPYNAAKKALEFYENLIRLKHGSGG